MNEKPKLGIKQQIQLATSIPQIQSLLAKIRSYRGAHPSTLRKCDREAAKRIKEIAP